LVDCAPFELDCAVFCFALLPGAAGGIVDGEFLMLALAIEPPALPAEGAEIMPTKDRAGAVQSQRSPRLAEVDSEWCSQGKSVGVRVKQVLYAS
jgi:hypothetical protein